LLINAYSRTYELYIALEKYPIKDIAKLLKYGFTSAFNMNYPVPRLPLDTQKLKCVLQYHVVAYEVELPLSSVPLAINCNHNLPSI
jgi:hypothetical protein